MQSFLKKLTLEANAMKYLWLLLVWYLAAIGIWCWVEPRRSFPDLLDFGDVDVVDARGTIVNGSLCHQMSFQYLSISACHLRHGQSLPLFPKDCGSGSIVSPLIVQKVIGFKNCNNFFHFFAQFGHGMLLVMNAISFSPGDMTHFRGRMCVAHPVFHSIYNVCD